MIPSEEVCGPCFLFPQLFLRDESYIAAVAVKPLTELTQQEIHSCRKAKLQLRYRKWEKVAAESGHVLMRL